MTQPTRREIRALRRRLWWLRLLNRWLGISSPSGRSYEQTQEVRRQSDAGARYFNGGKSNDSDSR